LTENYGKIYGYIIRLLPCYDVAEDLMQETTSAMWEQHEAFTPGTDFVAWGCSIAYYKILDYRHKKQRDQKIIFNEEILKLIEESIPAKESLGNPYLQKLRKCLAKLRAGDLDLIRLRYWKSVRAADIAKRLNTSLRSVYYNLARIQGVLLTCVERDDP
jgi:RNA polymerase sigma-70 factor (ECF subfamily)